MLHTWKAQTLRTASADVPVRRFSTWLYPHPGIPVEHHHSHPRYRGLHLVTTGELASGVTPIRRIETRIGTVRRFLSAFWGSDATPRRLKRSARA